LVFFSIEKIVDVALENSMVNKIVVVSVTRYMLFLLIFGLFFIELFGKVRNQLSVPIPQPPCISAICFFIAQHLLNLEMNSLEFLS